MPPSKVSVVIPTYNRPLLLQRAVASALAASNQGRVTEVIVIDDVSTERLPDFADNRVRILRQIVNAGPGPARDRGIRLAANPWVVLLDDDDMLLPGALDEMVERAEAMPGSEQFPIFQFTHSHGYLLSPFCVVTLDDYLCGHIRGDFMPLVNRECFLRGGFAYPDNRAGGEHLLWWKIAQGTGIPSWRLDVCQLGTEADNRLTSARSQALRADAHLALAQQTISEFGMYLLQNYPQEYKRVLMAKFAYALLSGQKSLAARAIQDLPVTGTYKVMMHLVTFLPVAMLKQIFLGYRKLASYFLLRESNA